MRKVDNSWQTKECVLIAVGHWFGSMWCKVGHENISLQVLTKFNLADAYKGQEDPDGEDYNVEAAEDGPRPFTCLLDTGLKRTSTGSKVFAALKVAFSVHVHLRCIASRDSAMRKRGFAMIVQQHISLEACQSQAALPGKLWMLRMEGTLCSSLACDLQTQHIFILGRPSRGCPTWSF